MRWMACELAEGEESGGASFSIQIEVLQKQRVSMEITNTFDGILKHAERKNASR